MTDESFGIFFDPLFIRALPGLYDRLAVRVGNEERPIKIEGGEGQMVFGRNEREPEVYEDLIKEIKRIIRDRPPQSANGVYWDLVSDIGHDEMQKRHWTQEEVYATIRKMRDRGIIEWNAVTRMD